MLKTTDKRGILSPHWSINYKLNHSPHSSSASASIIALVKSIDVPTFLYDSSSMG